MIDLHIHTNCSDGEYAPEETIRMAYEAGITAAAVTDHDTASGIAAAQKAAADYGITFFPGIEISVQGGKELHILGYGIDPCNPGLLEFCAKHARDRKVRCSKMLAYLQDHGVNMTLEDVRRCNDGRTTGRPHFARALVEKGYASSVQNAFDRYLTTPEFYARVERPKPLPADGIRVIREAGGVAVLAHPHQLKLEEPALDALLVQLKEMGLQGIEAYYSRHTSQQTACYLALAEKHDLLYTCGSDFHGSGIKPDIALGTGIDKNLCITDSRIPEQLSLAIRRQNRSKCI
ncbi:MAG: PHP domain-containing protein [Ruminococcus sp.]